MAKRSQAQRRAQSAAAEKAAALRKEAERKERRKRSALIGALAVVVVVVVAGVAFVVANQDSTPVAVDAPVGAVVTTGAGTDAQPGRYAVPWGEADAPVTVVVYEDFLCPFCRSFEVASTPVLAPYVESGDVQVQYRALNFLSRAGDYSEEAANAFAVVLDAAGPEVAKNFHDGLFATQPSESGPFPDDEALLDVAEAAGADRDAVADGISDLAFEDWVAGGTEAAQEEGVNATPTVFVDGEQLEPSAEQDLTTQLEQQIESALAG